MDPNPSVHHVPEHADSVPTAGPSRVEPVVPAEYLVQPGSK